ncbi:MAG: VCBS repeat-containing protein, partial [Planctomycetaceae bacterium]|nr:VCBS repeat-containing protein [Planctomycetaceae bacterium]
MSCFTSAVRPLTLLRSLRSSSAFRAGVAVGIVLTCGVADFQASVLADDEQQLAQYYGFSGLELFELDDRASNLMAGDFNSDGRMDVVVIDNHNSCLKMLLQRVTPVDGKSSAGGRVNDLRSDWRLMERQIGVDRQLSGMAVADLNHDGRTDVCYVGAPDRLFVKYQP